MTAINLNTASLRGRSSIPFKAENPSKQDSPYSVSFQPLPRGAVAITDPVIQATHVIADPSFIVGASESNIKINENGDTIIGTVFHVSPNSGLPSKFVTSGTAVENYEKLLKASQRDIGIKPSTMA